MSFIVRGFCGGRHPHGVPIGTLLMETSHVTEASAYIEIEAWKARMRRGEVSRVELIDQRVGGRLTNLNIFDYTQIPWSWLERAS